MTPGKAILRAGLLGASLLAVSACGTDRSIAENRETIKATLGQFLNRGAAQPAVSPAQQVAQALANSNEPLILLASSAGATTVLTEIAQNGPHDHYATSARQVITLRDGVLVATRGLGNDLMSSDIDGSLALIRARKPGTARREMRYLDGEDRTFTYSFDCTVSVGASESIETGLIKARVTNVTESCESTSRSFKNIYKVDGKGQVLASNQWFSPIGGSYSMSQLRR